MHTRTGNVLWGAASSAHAVEGGNFNSDWWRWEQRGGRIHDGASSKFAADHYARFRDDFRLARKLGHQAHLFTLEWSRIEPEPGRFDQDALDHYAHVLDALRVEGLEPFCCLVHATSPAWFDRQGGWAHREAPAQFERYAIEVATRFGPQCRWWIPVLEPMHTVEMAWIEGLWPPGRGNPLEARQAFRHLVQAHALAYHALKTARPDALIGASTRARTSRPFNEYSAWDYRAMLRDTARCNRWLFDALTTGRWPRLLGQAPPNLAGTADFLAFSYYGRECVRFSPIRPGRLFSQRVDSAGRPVKNPRPEADPEGLRAVIQELSGYGLPMVISGNGIATKNDAERCRFLLNQVSVVLDCLNKGSDIRAYFHYSLLDGFEWSEGYEARYGLIHVDDSSQARTPNASAYLYKDICDSGAIRSGAVQQFCPGWQEREEPQ